MTKKGCEHAESLGPDFRRGDGGKSVTQLVMPGLFNDIPAFRMIPFVVTIAALVLFPVPACCGG